MRLEADAGPGALTVEAMRALRALAAVDAPPILLGYHPVAQVNPFPILLYRGCPAAGVAPLPVPEDTDIAQLTALARLGHRVVLHLHWLNRPVGRATSPADARDRAGAFLAILDELRAAGGRVAWTVHNILPHGTRFEAEEAWFSGEIARRADVIHVMAAATPELVAPYFELPRERLLHVPHPSYVGAYADIVSREGARHELGILPDELVYLVAGSIQPYKGLEELLDAWDALPLDGAPRRLLIAGAPTRDPALEPILERASLHPTVLLHAERIESDRMQVFLRAADVAVLPYRRSLNSGALMLAFSFDLPVIVPAGGGLAELVDAANGLTFEPGSREALVRALVDAPGLATPAGRAAAAATARRFGAAELSTRFAAGLRALLDGSAATDR